MSQSLFDRLKESGKLPTPPGVVLRVLELTRRQDVAVPEIAETLGQDPVLAAKVLRFANSPMAGVPHEVTSLHHAVALMGTRGAKMTALSFAMLGSGGTQSCVGFDPNQYAMQSIGCGVAAKLLAAEAGEVDEQEAFLVGLLSQIGRAVLAAGLPEEYAAVLSQAKHIPCDLPPLEMEAFGESYPSISAQLLRSWDIPEKLCSAIDEFQNARGGSQQGNLSKVLLVAEIAAAYLCPDTQGELPNSQPFVDAALEVLGIENERCSDLLARIATEIETTRALLEMSKGKARSAEDIQDEVRERIAELSLAMHMENKSMAQQKEDLLRRATTDALTGIGNRVAFDSRLSLEMERARRSNTPFALLMIDVDKFKVFNDTYGHQAGDLVLQVVAKVLDQNIRKVDFLARYGGEEFVVIVPDTLPKGVAVLAIRLREVIEKARVDWHGEDLSVTISVGAAAYTNLVDPHVAADVIAAADAQMYAAKRAGRNRVRMIQDAIRIEETATS